MNLKKELKNVFDIGKWELNFKFVEECFTLFDREYNSKHSRQNLISINVKTLFINLWISLTLGNSRIFPKEVPVGILKIWPESKF